MYRKLLSWILMLSLCLGILPGINSSAMEDVGGTVFVVDSIETGEQGGSEEGEIEISQNDLKGHIEDVETLPAASGRRLEQTTSNKRYTVLVLDNSPSVKFLSLDGSTMYTADTALPYVKEASKKFVEDMRDVPGDNFIAIVSFDGSNSRVASRFTKDTDALLKTIDALSASGDHNVSGSLAAAEELIDSPLVQGAKSVVLFTTGMTKSGPSSDTGKYNTLTIGGSWKDGDSGTYIYKYANVAYEEAERLKEKCTLYSIGLFQTMKDMPEQGRDIVSFFKLCACDWASSKNHFYDVKDPADLEFAFGQVADNIVKRTGRFYYTGGSRDYSAVYYYDDNYFKESSYEYNQHLATMSLCLELSAWNSAEESDYTRKMKNAENLLDEIGFVGFDHNYTDFSGDGITGKPTMDSVGVVAANKQLSFDDRDYTLIAVAIRGGGYEREWASDFTLGKSGDHQGFSQARDIVIAFLEDYVREQGINGDLKIWITGYSRAAATANMVAAALDDGAVDLSGCSLRAENMFAYTFESPAGTVDPEARNKRYYNIFNIINENDPVPKVAPLAWGFDRYGKDNPLSSPEADGLTVYKEHVAAMLERYREMDGYRGYIVDDFQMKKLNVDLTKIFSSGQSVISFSDNFQDTRSQGQFLDDYITIYAKEGFRKRSTYAKDYQDKVRYTMGVIFEEGEAEADRFFNLLEEKLSKDYGELIYELFKPFGGESDVCRKLIEFLNECLNNAGITNYSPKEFGAEMYPILYLAAGVAEKHSHLTTTLFMNLEGILQAHYPELCLAWMQSMDTNYTTNAKLEFSSGKYRIVRINCPIDVTVYDTEGNVLAAITDDTPQPDGHVVAAYTAEGEKLLYLPINHDYIVRLAATGDGVMNLAIQEYDPYAGESNHLILFHDIEVREGQEYTMCLPCYSQEDIESMTGTAADTDYTLFFDATEILPSEELTGEEVFNAYYEVDASADDAAKGLVFGAGIRQYGTFVKLEALAYGGYEFVGWYEGENLVSTEAEYRFRVSEDRELVAVFRESEGDQEGKDDKEDIGDKEDKEDEGDTGDKGDKGDENDREDGWKGAVEGAFRVVSHWSTGFNAEITLTNMTEETIHDWEVVFDLPYDIESVWNGVMVSHENGVYTVRNAGYNWDIQPGESVTFGFCVTAETETVTEPTAYALVERQVGGVEGDFEVTYKVHSDWGTGFNGQIEIRNLSAKAVQDWTLEFDCAHTFTQFGNGEIISHEGDHYIIKNKGYNATIETGQTLVLDFAAECGDAGSGVEPTGYRLHAAGED